MNIPVTPSIMSHKEFRVTLTRINNNLLLSKLTVYVGNVQLNTGGKSYSYEKEKLKYKNSWKMKPTLDENTILEIVEPGSLNKSTKARGKYYFYFLMLQKICFVSN